jgi:Undecaprenyl-phosphate glucose phosphotransferase
LIHQRHRKLAALSLTGDLLATLVSFFLAWYLRFVVQVVPNQFEVPEYALYLRILPLILITWPVIFYFHGLYQVRRGQSRMDELATLVVAILLGSIFLLSFAALYRPLMPDGTTRYVYSRWFLAIFFVVSVVVIASTRFLIRSVIRARRMAGHNLQRILVVGAGHLGKEVTQKLQMHREMGLQVAGFVDDDPGKAGRAILGVPVLGTIDETQELLERESIDQVLIALPLEAYKKTQRLLEQIGNECVSVRLVPDIFQFTTMSAAIEDLDGTPIINLSQVPLQGWRSLAKRAMDVAIAIAAIVVLLPFLPLVAALIWWDDKGPIFYGQERMGLDGRSFTMLKFRSMRVGAENTTGPIWARQDDPRRTRIGSFLRRTSLDELPQLWNVVKGEMSIVGPRPERPTFVSEFRQQLPKYMQRHRVKAGITGWAQVHGWRGNTSIRKRLQYDLYYIQNWTLGLDLKILWLTFRQGMTKNAY